MKFKPNLRRKSRIEIIPMIDVLFFLLVFFMFFTSFRTSPTGIDINLPSAETVSEQEQTEIIITIDENEQVYVGRDPVTLDQLRNRVQEGLREDQNLLIIIEADRLVSYARIIDVMDNVRMVGGYRLALSAERAR